MKRTILTYKRGVSDCYPGHGNFPCETYRNRRSKKARSRDRKKENQVVRQLQKRELQELMKEAEEEMIIEFKPNIETVDNYVSSVEVSQDTLKNETMFFSCSPEFIEEHKDSAPITYELMTNFILPAMYGMQNDKNIIIDTRVNMLMKGQYPSIPGWHCDAVPRGYNGQPDFSQCDDSVQHYMCLVSDRLNEESDSVSGTQFITNLRRYSLDPDKVWQSLHEEVMKDSDKKIRSVKDREVIRFNQLAIHTATPAVSNGWRLFFRASLLNKEPANEIRRQTQIYVDPNNAGW
jgi:hypothetical protein